jgi:Ca2+-binding EF-hand superfamily protein
VRLQNGRCRSVRNITIPATTPVAEVVRLQNGQRRSDRNLTIPATTFDVPIMLRTYFAAGLTTVMLLSFVTVGLAQQPAVPNGTSAVAPAEGFTEDLVFLGAQYPIFVRLFAYIDGREIRTTRAERVAKAVAELDDDRDGSVSQTERDAHPRALRMLGIPEKWANLLPLVDRNPQDGKITADEISQFLSDRFGATVTLAGRARRGNQAVELFDLVDADHDQRLTEAELKGIPARLHKLDADGDDAFSVVEVEPFRNPFVGGLPNATASSDDIPWAISKSAGERLMTRFDVAPKDQKLTAQELGLPEAAIAAADSDRDGGLSLAELQKWLPTVEPNFGLITNSFIRKAGRTELSWIDYSPKKDAEQTADSPPTDAAENGSPDKIAPNQKSRNNPTQEAGKKLEVKLADQPLELQMTTAGRGLTSDVINLYRNAFRRADVDKNKYLDKTEFTVLAELGASFEMLDTDENGQVYEPELVAYIALEVTSEQSRVILSFDRNERSLFGLLDRNSDRRLTPREFLSTFDRWQAFDHDADHVLNRSELSGRMRMTVEIPQSRLLRSSTQQFNQVSGEPVIRELNDGPAWFHGMDRNKDGDVSRREFLGTDAQFRKWDRNGDGLISKSE